MEIKPRIYWLTMALYLALSVFFFVQDEWAKCTVAVILGVCVLRLYIVSFYRGDSDD